MATKSSTVPVPVSAAVLSEVQAQRCLQNKKKALSKLAASKKSSVCCVCPSLEDSGHMLACDTCRNWLHNKCVNISPSLAPSFPFVCPFCVKCMFVDVKKCSSAILSLQQQLLLVSDCLSSVESSSVLPSSN